MEDLFLDVNHGPFIVDNNVFLSPVSIRTQSEGGAYVHNLITGVVFMWPDPNRFTPYFLPHSTDMAALTTIFSGDDRFYNNVFVGTGNKTNKNSSSKHGLEGYNNARLPVWLSGNTYYYGAQPSNKDMEFTNDSTFNLKVKLVKEGETGYLYFSCNPSWSGEKTQMITTKLLGKAKIPKAAFDNPDGTPLKIDSDYFGKKRSEVNPSAGPFEKPGEGEIKLKIW